VLYIIDTSGLSDPYLKISIANQSICSKTIYQTNNPKWFETLHLDNINLYGDYKSISKNPPEIIIDVFDRDAVGVSAFLLLCLTFMNGYEITK
jgi:hypothetical protein